MSFTLFILLIVVLLGRPQDFFPGLAPLRLALVVTAATVAATVFEKKTVAMGEFFKARESRTYAFLYLAMIIGIPFAYHRRQAFDYVLVSYLPNLLFYYLFLSQVDTVKRMKTVIFAICVSTLFYSLLSLRMGSYSADRLSFGTMYDPNDLAYFLVSLFPLSILFIVRPETWVRKTVAIAAVGVAVVTILLTGSRGGLIGLVGVLMMFFITSGSIRWSHKILLTVLAAAMIVMYSDRINTERYLSLANVESDYNVSGQSGRLDIWKNGLRLFLANPLTGVGVNCFPNALGDLRASEGAIPKWQVSHNSYLQMAAEVGVVGLFLFLSLIITCRRSFAAALQHEPMDGTRIELAAIAQVLQIGFAGLLITAFFLTQAYSILFTLFFAFSAQMTSIRSTQQDESAAPYSAPEGETR